MIISDHIKYDLRGKYEANLMISKSIMIQKITLYNYTQNHLKLVHPEIPLSSFTELLRTVCFLTFC